MRVLALLEPDPSLLLLVKILEIREVYAAVHATRYEGLVLVESHARDLQGMLLQEVLLDTKDQIDDDDSSVDETDCQVLEVVLKGLEDSAADLVWHSESTSSFFLLNLSLYICSHFFNPGLCQRCLLRQLLLLLLLCGLLRRVLSWHLPFVLRDDLDQLCQRLFVLLLGVELALNEDLAEIV